MPLKASQSMLRYLLSYQSYVLISLALVGFLVFWDRLVNPVAFDSVELPMNQPIVCHQPNVIDGDSLYANCADQIIEIRLMDIDAPELAQIPWGDKAKAALSAMLANQITVNLQGKDIYQRYLGYVFVGETEVSEELIRQGLARVYRRYDPKPVYIEAMKAAKVQRVGIWKEIGLQQDPQRFRRLYAGDSL